ncbi:MAG: FecR domain-containing protein [Balneolaceae bacterium]
MATEQNLPENDLDLLLAKSLGSSLDTNASFSKLNDSLIDQLVEYKNEELLDYDNQTPNSISIWDAIEARTQRKAIITPLLKRPITYTWAAAAVLLIAAFIGFYWISLNPTPQLIAQSDATISTVILEDGTEVLLRPYSKLFEIAYTENKRSYSLEGEAFFEVKTDQNRPFSVQAGEGTITVLGTRFNVSNWGSTTQVFLEEGSIKFSTENDSSVILIPGQQAQINAGILTNPKEVDADQFKDWISNTIVFNGSNPEDVVAEIGQHFNIRIDVSQIDDQSTLNGSLQLNSINQTLEDLGLVLGGTFRSISENEFTFISLN